MALFGLGAPEIAVCLAVAAVILGPDKLAGELPTQQALEEKMRWITTDGGPKLYFVIG